MSIEPPERSDEPVIERALVLIEFQRQWTDPGLYNLLIRRQLDRRNVMETARRVAAAARREGVTVIHAPLVIDPAHKQGVLGHLTLGRMFTKGTPRADFSAGVYEDGDVVVQGRTCFDAFVGTDLEQLLVERGAEQVFFGGLTTDQCVARTLATALRIGIDGYLVPEITATFCGYLQRRTERRFRQQLAPVARTGLPVPLL